MSDAEKERLRPEETRSLEDALFGFPEDIQSAFRMYQECDRLSKRLADRAKGLKKFLTEKIPIPGDAWENGKAYAVQEGVVHKAWQQNSVAYKEALKEIKDELVPKTRWDRVDQIIDEHTKKGVRDKVEAEPQDEIPV